MTPKPDSPFSPRRPVSVAVKAIEHFTDREEALAAFARHMQARDDQVLPVLNFHGVGGIGKSSLMHKLISDLRAEDRPIPHALLDLREGRERDPVRGLTVLRIAFGKFGMPFHRFDLVSSVLAATEGAGEAELLQLSPWSKAAVDVISALPVVGTPVAATKAVLERVLPGLTNKYPGLREWLERIGGDEEIQRLRGLQREDLVYELVAAMGADLSEGAPQRSGHACRAVIFVDTYEALWTNLAGPRSPQGVGVDAWVREVYTCLQEANAVLLVIAGRDLLCWPEVDEQWRQVRDQGDLCRYLDAHLIGGLSADDTQRYLALRGVGHGPEVGAATPLQVAIIDCARVGLASEGCHPLFVGMCVDIVHNERGPNGRGADPPAEWFRGIPSDDVARKLAARFLTSLSGDEMPELVRSLSVARWFDQELVEAQLGSPARGRPAHDRLEQLSFTSPRQDGGLTIHLVMRDALLYLMESKDDGAVTQAHEWHRTHWQARFDAGDEAAEVEAWYHHLHLEPEQALDAWRGAARAARDARDGPRGRALLAWWDGLDLTDEEWRTRLGDEAWAQALQSLAWRLDELKPFALQHALVLVRTIEYYQAVLRVRTEDAYPSDWASTQNNLGNAYSGLPTGDRGENLARAIACYEVALRVHTEDAYPREWARAQTSLGVAYKNLPTGEPGENLARAIDCYQAALRVRTEEAYPLDWAWTQNNLGDAYSALPTGDRGENLVCAIDCYEAALRVHTEEAYPREWARALTSLGVAYKNLPTGELGENLAHAIEWLQAALRVRTEEAYPRDWASNQNNLGDAYSALPTGDSGKDLARAIACYEAALRVYTEEAYPRDWAWTQSILGVAYSALPTGEPGENLARAIECYQAALRVRTEEAYPRDWAWTQSNLGNAYSALPTGDRGENLARAIECYQAALRAYTEEAYPRDWATTRYSLACCHGLSGRIKESIDGLRAVIRANPDKYVALARDDEDFISLRDDERFQELLQGDG